MAPLGLLLEFMEGAGSLSCLRPCPSAEHFPSWFPTFFCPLLAEWWLGWGDGCRWMWWLPLVLAPLLSGPALSFREHMVGVCPVLLWHSAPPRSFVTAAHEVDYSVQSLSEHFRTVLNVFSPKLCCSPLWLLIAQKSSL